MHNVTYERREFYLGGFIRLPYLGPPELGNLGGLSIALAVLGFDLGLGPSLQSCDWVVGESIRVLVLRLLASPDSGR